MLFDTELKYEQAESIITYLKVNSTPTLDKQFDNKIK